MVKKAKDQVNRKGRGGVRAVHLYEVLRLSCCVGTLKLLVAACLGRGADHNERWPDAEDQKQGKGSRRSRRCKYLCITHHWCFDTGLGRRCGAWVV
jgi:hypothetical protein